MEEELGRFQTFSKALRNEGYITVKTWLSASNCPHNPAGLYWHTLLLLQYLADSNYQYSAHLHESYRAFSSELLTVR